MKERERVRHSREKGESRGQELANKVMNGYPLRPSRRAADPFSTPSFRVVSPEPPPNGRSEPDTVNTKRSPAQSRDRT